MAITLNMVATYRLSSDLTLHFVHTMYSCVPNEHNKRGLFP